MESPNPGDTATFRALSSAPAARRWWVAVQDRAWWIAATLVVAAFSVWGFASLRVSTDAAFQDTEAFLGHSLYIAEHGGLWGFLKACLDGSFPITERHPLYMLVLSLFASRELQFFLNAKVLNLVLGLAVLISFVWMVQRRYGRGPALLAALLYGMSNSLLVGSSNVTQEPLLVLSTLWLWWLLTEPGADPGAASAEARPTTRNWVIAGGCLGIAYLAKSPALLVAMAVVAAGLWTAHVRLFSDRRFWLFLLATAIVSSPLLVRNVVGFGTPLYEGVNSNITWLESWSEIGEEDSILRYDRYGIMTIDRNALPTAGEYIDKYGLKRIPGRLIRGLATETFQVAPKALAPDVDFLPAPIKRAWGLAVLGLALAGWWVRRKRWEASLLFFWSAAFLTFFGWDHMFPEPRYLAPLVPIWIAYASVTAWTLLQRVMDRDHAQQAVTFGVAAVALAATAWVATNGSLTRPQPIVSASPSYMRLINWFNENIEEGDRVLVGPTTEFYGLLWMVHRPITIVQVPSVKSLGAYQRYLAERKVRYLVINRQSMRGVDSSLVQVLSPYFQLDRNRNVVQIHELPGWRPVLKDDASPQRFVMLEALTRPTP
jgi:hypothetical protein